MNGIKKGRQALKKLPSFSFDIFFPLRYHIARWDSGCPRVTPWPNTGTGVRSPGEPVAVMAEHFLTDRQWPTRNGRLSTTGWFSGWEGERVRKRTLYASVPSLSRKTCPEGRTDNHGFLAVVQERLRRNCSFGLLFLSGTRCGRGAFPGLFAPRTTALFFTLRGIEIFEKR